jgi:hypothetical protein
MGITAVRQTRYGKAPTGLSFLLLSMALIAPNAVFAAGAGSALRVACDESDIGAQVFIDGKFKGECSVDILLPEGPHKIRVVRKIDNDQEQVFELDVRLADGTSKRVDVSLSAPQLNSQAQRRLNEDKVRAEAADKQNKEREFKEFIRAAKARIMEARQTNPKAYIADANGCFVSAIQIEGDSFAWNGPCQEGVSYGQGTLTLFRSGALFSTLTGSLIAGLAEGKVVTAYANGARFEGQLLHGKIVGSGTLYHANGDRYDGPFVDGNEKGKGTFIYPNGDRYDGDVADNMRNGIGTYRWNAGNYFTGGWLNNKRSGAGKEFGFNGALLHDGKWEDDKQLFWAW